MAGVSAYRQEQLREPYVRSGSQYASLSRGVLDRRADAKESPVKRLPVCVGGALASPRSGSMDTLDASTACVARDAGSVPTYGMIASYLRLTCSGKSFS